MIERQIYTQIDIGNACIYMQMSRQKVSCILHYQNYINNPSIEFTFKNFDLADIMLRNKSAILIVKAEM